MKHGTNNGLSTLAPGVSVTGQLNSDGDIVIGGQIEGDVTGRSVEVTEGASIQGSLTARDVVIRGSVKGSIHARVVTLGAKAVVEGELTYERIEVALGAWVDIRFVPFSASGETAPNPALPRLSGEEKSNPGNR